MRSLQLNDDKRLAHITGATCHELPVIQRQADNGGYVAAWSTAFQKQSTSELHFIDLRGVGHDRD
jgi:hypothetical protein